MLQIINKYLFQLDYTKNYCDFDGLRFYPRSPGGANAPMHPLSPPLHSVNICRYLAFRGPIDPTTHGKVTWWGVYVCLISSQNRLNFLKYFKTSNMPKNILHIPEKNIFHLFTYPFFRKQKKDIRIEAKREPAWHKVKLY